MTILELILWKCCKLIIFIIILLSFIIYFIPLILINSNIKIDFFILLHIGLFHTVLFLIMALWQIILFAIVGVPYTPCPLRERCPLKKERVPLKKEPVPLHRPAVVVGRRARRRLPPTKLRHPTHLRGALDPTTEVADYFYICPGPDLVWRWSDEEPFDAYTGDYFPMKYGQFLCITSIPDYNTYYNGEPFSNDLVTLLEKADDLLSDELVNNPTGNYFHIFDSRHEYERIVHRGVDKVEGLSFKTFMQHVVIMTYDDIVETTDRRIYLSTPWDERLPISEDFPR